MRASRVYLVGLFGVAVLGAGVSVAAAVEAEEETFVATVVQTANMLLPGGGTFQIKIVVEKWTPLEERKRLLEVFAQGGSEALMKELRSQKAGYVVPPPFSRWPSWEIDVASSIDTPEGRIVRVFTERPIAFGEAYYNTRSKDYEFGIIELKLDKEGKGEGMTVPAAKLAMDEQGNLVVETLPYTTGPQRLMGVRKF